MGQSCCASEDADKTKQTAEETKNGSNRPHKRIVTDGSSSDSDASDSSNTNRLSTPTSTRSRETTPDVPHTEGEKEKARIGFEDAIQKGNDSLAMHFVQEYPELDLLQTRFDGGDNALQVAVQNKSLSLILYLLGEGISPNAQNPSNGETALHTAVRIRNVKIVTLLCQYNADTKITNNKYESPLAIASENGDEDITELLSPETQLIMGHSSNSLGNEPVPSTHMDDYNSADVNDILSSNNKNKSGAMASIQESVSHPNAQSGDYVTFDEKMTDSEKTRMEAIRVSRQNPFGKLKRSATKKALAEMDRIAHEKSDLPQLQGWLEKKQASMPYKWQKRWVVVAGTHFLWSDKQRNITNAKDVKERKKFNNSVNLMSIAEVNPVTKGKTQRKFNFTVGTRNKKKEYLWKCATKEDRDYWVKGLKKHMTHTKSVLSYLGTNN